MHELLEMLVHSLFPVLSRLARYNCHIQIQLVTVCVQHLQKPTPSDLSLESMESIVMLRRRSPMRPFLVTVSTHTVVASCVS